MRVLILGEGATDLGQLHPDGTVQREGCVPVFVRRLLAERQTQNAIEIRARELRKIRTFPRGPKRITHSEHGYSNKLRVVLGLDLGREADAIVVVVDRDGERNFDRIEELQKGRDELLATRKPCAVGVAIEMIEAWLLADEQALTQVLGTTVPRQSDPESLSSRDEQSEQNPRGRLLHLIENTRGKLTTTGDFAALCAEIANAASIAVIETRCKEGFEPFARQVREMVVS